MAYPLKSTVLLPTTIDLAKHKFNPTLHPHAPKGSDRGGEFISTHSSSSFSTSTRLPSGKHLTTSGETSATRYRTDELDVSENSKRLDVALQRAQSAREGTTEHEHAWDEVSAHLESLNRKVQTAQSKIEESKRRVQVQAADTKIDKTLYRLRTTTPTPKVKKTGEYVEETVKDARNVQLGQQVAGIAARVAGAAVGLIGATSSEHFVETFHKIAENPLMESGINVAVALAISALVAKIRGALKRRKDQKIEAAREVASA